jgi:hypothetical protein
VRRRTERQLARPRAPQEKKGNRGEEGVTQKEGQVGVVGIGDEEQQEQVGIHPHIRVGRCFALRRRRPLTRGAFPLLRLSRLDRPAATAINSNNS